MGFLIGHGVVTFLLLEIVLSVTSSPLLSIEDLAVRLRTTANALRCRFYRSPYNLPPRVYIPGDKRVFFDSNVVDEWLRNPQAFLPKPRACSQ